MLGGDRASGWVEMEGAAAVGAVAATARLGLGRRPPGECGPRRCPRPAGARGDGAGLRRSKRRGAAGRWRAAGAGPGRPAGPPLPAGGRGHELRPDRRHGGLALRRPALARPWTSATASSREGRACCWVCAEGTAAGRPLRAGAGGGQRACPGAGRPKWRCSWTSAIRRAASGSWRGWRWVTTVTLCFGLAIAGGRLWVADGEGAVLLALDPLPPSQAPCPSATTSSARSATGS